MSATDSTLPVNHGELWDRDSVATQRPEGVGILDVMVYEIRVPPERWGEIQSAMASYDEDIEAGFVEPGQYTLQVTRDGVTTRRVLEVHGTGDVRVVEDTTTPAAG